MTRVLVLYSQPADSAAFDRYYFETHVPIAWKLPGLRAYTVSAQKPMLVAGEQAPYLVAELDFDNAADFQAAMSSPEGQATVADLANFAQAGATVLTFEIRDTQP
jgi:uncharacterized protein (TIGR02118 family)